MLFSHNRLTYGKFDILKQKNGHTLLKGIPDTAFYRKLLHKLVNG
jgi:hypothetical protein